VLRARLDSRSRLAGATASIWSESVRARPTMPLQSASGGANETLPRVIDVRSCTRLSGFRFSVPSIAIFAVDSPDAGTRNHSLGMRPSVPGLVASEGAAEADIDDDGDQASPEGDVR
jgi:hypothetical protein